MQSNVRGISSHRYRKSSYDVTLASIFNDVIRGFYLSMLRRRHFPHMGAHWE